MSLLSPYPKNQLYFFLLDLTSSRDFQNIQKLPRKFSIFQKINFIRNILKFSNFYIPDPSILLQNLILLQNFNSPQAFHSIIENFRIFYNLQKFNDI